MRIGAVVLASLALAFVGCADEGEVRLPRHVVLPAGQTHEGWYFAAGDDVIIDGTVNGDVYAAARRVEVNGTGAGDLIAAGAVVRVAGTVLQDVRVVGQTVEIAGSVAREVTVAGADVRIERDAVVGGDLLAAAQNCDVDGSVVREAKVAAGTMTVRGSVAGAVDATVERLSVLPGARLAGTLEVHVPHKANVDIADGAVTGGVTVIERPEHRCRWCGEHGISWGFRFFWAAALFFTGTLFVLALPRRAAAVGTTILRTPGRTLAWGAVALVGVPVAAVLLCVTIVGIPLALIGLALYLALLYLSQLSLMLFVGQGTLGMEGKGRGAIFVAFVAGFVVVEALMLVPILGALLCLASVLFGLGALLRVARSAAAPPPAAS